MPLTNVRHAVVSMLLAGRWRLHVLDVEARCRHAGGIRATISDDVHHDVISMLLAEHCRPDSFYKESWDLCAGIIRATPGGGIGHGVFGTLFCSAFPSSWP